MHRKIDLQGIVQGVGMRPWVAGQARQLNLAGCTRNTPGGLTISVEGDCHQIEVFQQRLSQTPPASAVIEHIHSQTLPLTGRQGFEIQISLESGEFSADIPKDRTMCAACRDEQRDPANRRYQHAFISCVDCGPRFTITRRMPFDRSRTSMSKYPCCPACEAEYNNPQDRRYHAQTIACNRCGPRLMLRSAAGTLTDDRQCLYQAQQILNQGGILGLKGVGGYQLLCDAADDEAISRLRQWKGRQRKPLAIMCADLQRAADLVAVTSAEQQMLESSAAPIVVLSAAKNTGLSADLAPRLNRLGIMLPASPLHQLLADQFGGHLVVTSGNRRTEPTLINDREAGSILLEVADALLLHDREILHTADDSVVRMAGELPILLRHARGFAPSSFPTVLNVAPGVAVGGHMKCAGAVNHHNKLTLLPHIGDAGAIAGQSRLQSETMGIAQDLFAAQPQWFARDLHPDYGSNEIARSLNLSTHSIPHHVAHVLALVAEQQIQLPVLGVVFDGTGLGLDGGIWGGEFILLEERVIGQADAAPAYCWQRVGSVLTFPLPGGEAAIREPRRAALGLAWRLYGGKTDQIPEFIQDLFTPREWRMLISMLRHQVNCPETSSIGRMFDAIAACVGGSVAVDYDGEAAMQLEAQATGVSVTSVPSILISEGVWDWRPAVFDLFERITRGASAPCIAMDFHAALSLMIRQMVSGVEAPVLLTGGVFQNVLLLESTCAQLHQVGKQVFTHRAVPPNDGALALGQVLGAAASLHYKGDTTQCV